MGEDTCLFLSCEVLVMATATQQTLCAGVATDLACRRTPSGFNYRTLYDDEGLNTSDTPQEAVILLRIRNILSFPDYFFF